MSEKTVRDAFITDLMSRMTLDEKIGQMYLAQPSAGDTDIISGAIKSLGTEEKIRRGQVGSMLNARGPDVVRRYQDIAVHESRLGIPLNFELDVIHGHVTGFPTPLAMASSWNPDLVQNVARVSAREAAADGIDLTYSPNCDTTRDPRYGRGNEAFGESVYLISRYVEAMVKGYQGDDLTAPDSVMSCLKHFAGYGFVEAGRDYNTVDMSRLKIMETVLPPFMAGVKAGAGNIMNAFNDLNGVPASMDRWLMTDIARKKWGYEGSFTSDFGGISEMVAHGVGNLKTVSAAAVKAGLDMEMVSEGYPSTLKQSVEEGTVSMDDIDRACRKNLEKKYDLGLFDDPYRRMNADPVAVHLAPETRALARVAAAESCVLLKNDNAALPLKRNATIALIGPLANDQRNLPGMWSPNVNTEACVTVIDGLTRAAGDKAKILYAKGANITDDPVEAAKLNIFENSLPVKSAMIDERSSAEMIAEAVSIAEQSDVIVAVVGEAREHTGEASSRTNIDIPSSQRPLLEALSETAKRTGKPLVLVVMAGRALTLGWEREHSDAMLVAWHGGTEAGNGLADVLFGDYNPSGKLPTTFPRHVGQIPIYHDHKTTGRPLTGANNDNLAGKWEKFRSAYLDCRNDPEFPFGFGLSYTHFDYSPVKVNKADLTGKQTLKASVTLTNTGDRAGEEVVQLYITDPVCSRTRPVKELKGFQKVMLQPGEQKDVTFDITTEDLKFFITEDKFGWEPGDFIIHVGTHSQDTQTATVHWEKAAVTKRPKCEPKL
ncbi:beta-glucosidase BglX [Micavibrio aeruginosavorus]|uniref:beta-glucosidase BglX n=1 Tax=Micavibrio aeruginosavorus TaxID=349221 RepID=UPI003F4AC8B0